jgi:hypothetical protein
MATNAFVGLGRLCIPLTGVVAHTGGDIANMLNPEGYDLIVTRCTVYMITASTGAANLNLGIGTSATEHDQTELCSALACNGAVTGKAYNGYANGDAADALVIWPHDGYFVANASASTVGFTGYAFIDYISTGTTT